MSTLEEILEDAFWGSKNEDDAAYALETWRYQSVAAETKHLRDLLNEALGEWSTVVRSQLGDEDDSLAAWFHGRIAEIRKEAGL